MATSCRAVSGLASSYAMVTGWRSSRPSREDDMPDTQMLNDATDGPAGRPPAAGQLPAAGRIGQPWVLAGRALTSRLIVGTGGVPSMEILRRVLGASGTEVATVAIRRVAPAGTGSVLGTLRQAGVHIVPN